MLSSNFPEPGGIPYGCDECDIIKTVFSSKFFFFSAQSDFGECGGQFAHLLFIFAHGFPYCMQVVAQATLLCGLHAAWINERSEAGPDALSCFAKDVDSHIADSFDFFDKFANPCGI